MSDEDLSPAREDLIPIKKQIRLLLIVCAVLIIINIACIVVSSQITAAIVESHEQSEHVIVHRKIHDFHEQALEILRRFGQQSEKLETDLKNQMGSYNVRQETIDLIQSQINTESDFQDFIYYTQQAGAEISELLGAPSYPLLHQENLRQLILKSRTRQLLMRRTAKILKDQEKRKSRASEILSIKQSDIVKKLIPKDK